VWLDGGQLTAETARSTANRQGANIFLRDVDLLRLENNSLISARALGNADGGNVTIDARNGYVIGLPFENSDIFATAEEGNGGQVNISANRIWGFTDQTNTEFRPEQLRANETNDISASSEFGLAGTITFDVINIDPSRGLAEVPVDLIDEADQVGQVCPTGRGAAERLGRFVITGRGGISPSPLEVLDAEDITVDWMDVPETSQIERLDRPVENEQISSTASAHLSPEAQGWVIGTDGQVHLVAQTGRTLRRPLLTDEVCP
jgi:large exoprotein involved in heme utilization and adhesion